MLRPHHLISELVARHVGTLGSDDEVVANAAEMIIVDVIMLVHEVNAPHARSILSDMLSEDGE